MPVDPVLWRRVKAQADADLRRQIALAKEEAKTAPPYEPRDEQIWVSPDA